MDNLDKIMRISVVANQLNRLIVLKEAAIVSKMQTPAITL
jgi:hypothetical protein